MKKFLINLFKRTNDLSLKKGDIIDVVFPAKTPKKSDLSKIKKLIKNLGLVPRIFEEKKLKKKNKEGYLIVSNETKLEQLYKALESKDSKLVWCWTGGYGSGELLQGLRKRKKIKQKKLFIGYSDITFITMFLQQEWGWETLYAPVVNDMICEKKTKMCKKGLLKILHGKKSKKLKLKLINNSKIQNFEAKITGGCLSMVIASFGTKNQIKCKNKILFLEDIGESGFRLRRKFIQVTDFIIDNKQIPKTILLGDFTASNSRKGSNIKLFNKLIKEIDERLKTNGIYIPILQSKKLGHVENMHPLFLGRKTFINKKREIILTQ